MWGMSTMRNGLLLAPLFILPASGALGQAICQTQLSWCALSLNANVGQACWCGNIMNGGVIIRSMGIQGYPNQPNKPRPRRSRGSSSDSQSANDDSSNSDGTSSLPKQTVKGGAESSGCVEGLGDCGTFASNVVEDPQSRRSLASASLGSGFCSAIDNATKSSSQGFRSIKGAKDDDGDWSSQVSLDGFRRCYIQAANGDVGENFYCTMPSGDFSNIERKVIDCLGGAAPRSHVDTHGRRHDRFDIAGTQAEVSVWETTSGGISLSIDNSSD